MGDTHFSLLVHLVWSTKDREPLLDVSWRDRLHAYMGETARAKNSRLLCAGGMPDHVHALVSIPTSLSVSQIANALKANSSRWIHETYSHLHGFAWQAGYGAFSVSLTRRKVVQEYIANQEAHHRTVSFQEEYITFLKKHGIQYDPKYLWA